MAASEQQRFVVLKGGLAIPITPLLLVLDLENRGFKLERDGSDILIEPFNRLTDSDKADIRRWKYEVLQVLDYVAPGLVQ